MHKEVFTKTHGFIQHYGNVEDCVCSAVSIADASGILIKHMREIDPKLCGQNFNGTLV